MAGQKTLENLMPIYKIEKDCILSKRGDITLGFEVSLPEIFTLSAPDYETIHQAWLKAIRLLPPHTVFHKQDWYVECRYSADFNKEDLPFLARASEHYFHERPYLDHKCYVFLTKAHTARRNATALFSTLIRPNLVPVEAMSDRELEAFFDKAGQFAKVLEDSSYISIRRLTDDDLASTPDKAGLIERYCYLLHEEETPVIRDIELMPELKVGDFHLQVFSLADAGDLPSLCGPRINYDKYCSDKTKFSISFAAPLGLMLPVNHIYNQYIIIDDTRDTLKKMEDKRLRLQSLSAYSRENNIGREAVSSFLNEAISQQRQPVKAHFNIVAWTSERAKMGDVRNTIAAAMAQMDARARQETSCAPQLFWAAMPGNEADIPLHDTFDVFAEQASCFLTQETNYRSSISPVGIRLADRLYGYPLTVDISDLPMHNGLITNRNKMILGPSGSGKSFFTNALVRSYVEQGAHAVIVDVGHSYKGISDLLGGYYFTYTEKDPIKFNPFYLDGEELDTEKKEAIKTLLLSLWKKDDENFSRSEYVTLSNALQAYFDTLKADPSIFPSFNTFYVFLRDTFVHDLRSQGVKEKEFDIDNFLYVLKPYFTGGEYDYLLNASENLDLLHQRLIIFELDNIKDHQILLPLTTIIITQVFLDKMRKLKGVRKILLIEEAWKAIMRQGMANYIRYVFKTVRKFYGEAIIVTQEVDDIISSPIVKQTIIANSDCKILLDQTKYQNRFEQIQELLGLTDKEKALVLSINRNNDPTKKYKEVFISLGSQSKVYRTEVSLEEYLAYTTEEKEKMLVQAFATKYGSLKKGISMLARQMRESKEK